MVETEMRQMAPQDLRLLEKNARYMKRETFQRLKDNVERDKALTSVPFAARDADGRYTVLSGNHRVMAAIDAGLVMIDVMVTDEDLTEDQRVAIQLSHNELVGLDDPQKLRELYDSIGTVDYRVYSGLDDKRLELLDDVDYSSYSGVQLDWSRLTLIFLPDEIEALERAFSEALAFAEGLTWIVPMALYEDFLKNLDRAGRSHNVSNQSTALQLMMGVFQRNLSDLQEGYLDEHDQPTHGGKVPLSTVLGSEYLSANRAAAVKRALDVLVSVGAVTPENLADGIAVLAEVYLAEGE